MNKNINNISIIPVVTYPNSLKDKRIICIDNKGKSGIYRWNNLKTNKNYIGSSGNLSCRFNNYYSSRYLIAELEKSSSIIYRSILKHGYSKFSLDILEYCDRDILISREQYYIDLLKPEYNILKIAGYYKGFKHP